MTTVLLVNPAAGHGQAAHLAAKVLQSAEHHWRDVTMLTTSAPGEGVELVRRATEQGAARVLVLGGDGTAHEAANGILSAAGDHSPALGIIPVGTGNDYAKLTRTQGLPTLSVVPYLVHGQVVRHDVGKAWNEYFLNSIGIGFDAEVARRVSGFRRVRGTPAYLAAAGLTFGGFKPFRATVSYGEVSFTDTLMLLEVGIGAVVGGGFRLTPDARPDDGLFDVCAIQRLGLFGFLTKLPLAMLGWHTRLKQVRMFQTAKLTVQGLDQPLVAQLDGEVRSGGETVEITLEPRRLCVIVAGKRPSAQWERPLTA